MIEIKKLSRGSYIAHKGEPYRIKKIGLVVVGTHSHTKTKVEMAGLFSGKKESLTMSSHERVEDIEIIKRHGQLIAKTGNEVQVMSMDNYEMLDADITPELLNEVNEGDDVTYVEFGGRARVIEKRER
ncbi:hypothetical protein BEH94_10415 [Candidatus Altiarchaeales archaeon WOR_SM1_SCG]|nr:hypothetical protein BEH94_10415 [Candidatus Altiarchaeales archaeon WOR_SM1_SCG]